MTVGQSCPTLQRSLRLPIDAEDVDQLSNAEINQPANS